MKKVTLFGGSFNPIHNGHIALAKSVLEAALADEVWLMVSPQNPLKASSSLQPELVRYALVKQALEKVPSIQASDFEFHLPRPSFTWNTLQALRRVYPHIEFSLLIGGDNWQCFDKWRNYQDILATTPIIVYPRSGTEVAPQRFEGNVHLLTNVPFYDVSSTMIRERVANSESIDTLVPASIVEQVCKFYSL